MLIASSSLSLGDCWSGFEAVDGSAAVAMVRRAEVDIDLETGLGDFCAALGDELEKDRRCCKGRCDEG